MKNQSPSPVTVRKRLLGWFDRHKRDMPWRGTHDPYRIWLAEIMLQQTRVQAVVPYYRRFLKRFPTVESLARTRSILKFWAGLGYYSRARNLHKTAKQIVREHGGKFPRQLEDALQLPGVGPYTARAILSIAYGQRLAVVDGNVARVLIRLLRLHDADPGDRQTLQVPADKLVSPSRPGDFNQALMELGSTVCLPRQPRCTRCPLEKLCAARQAGVEQQIPLRRPKRARPRLKLNVFVLERDGKVLLTRESRGYFSGLWHFPYAAGRTKPSTNGLGLKIEKIPRRPLTTITHETTMRALVLRVFHLSLHGGKPSNSFKNIGHARWVRLNQAAKLGVGSATRKILAALRDAQKLGE